MKKLLRAIVVLLPLAVTRGCFVVPVENAGHKDFVGGFLLPPPSSTHEVVSGSRILPQQVTFVQPGRTSRTEITNLFSQPWAYYPDMGVMVYYWECVDWHWAGGVFDHNDSATGAGDVTSMHYWFVKFDTANLVQKHGFIKVSPDTPTKKLADRWIKSNRCVYGDLPGVSFQRLGRKSLTTVTTSLKPRTPGPVPPWRSSSSASMRG